MQNPYRVEHDQQEQGQAFRKTDGKEVSGDARGFKVVISPRRLGYEIQPKGKLTAQGIQVPSSRPLFPFPSC